MTASRRGRTSASGVPGSGPSSSTRMPVWSVPSSSSRSDRIIPSDVSPRSFARSSFCPPGRSAPGSATATVAPAPKFHAPQTIWRGDASPTSTWQSWSRSAFGCLPASSTRPTRYRPRLPSVSATPRRSIRSTSATETLIRAASSSSGTSTATYSRNQLIGTLISELPQEAKVVLQEHPEVGNAVAEQGDPLLAEAEGETRHLVGVVADVAEHVRVDHPGAGQLDPARSLARRAAGAVTQKAGHGDADGRLREREEVGDEPNLALRPEQRAADVAQRAFEVGEGDPAVDREALHLVEDRRVRRVDGVAPVHAARRAHVDRRLPLHHHPDL